MGPKFMVTDLESVANRAPGIREGRGITGRERH